MHSISIEYTEDLPSFQNISKPIFIEQLMCYPMKNKKVDIHNHQWVHMKLHKQEEMFQYELVQK